MKALQVNEFSEDYSGMEVVETPRPAPKTGEVLIEVEAGAVLPGDALQMRGIYIDKRIPPYIAGNVGIGRVVGSGGGLMGRFLEGKRVLFSPGEARSGTWAEFAIADAMAALPVDKDVPPQVAMGTANALTAVGLLHRARALKAKAVVINAAASGVGQYINLHGQSVGLPIINIVRSERQAGILRKINATHILDQTAERFEEELRALSTKLSATVAVDAIAGPAPDVFFRNLPERSTTLSIGNLSGQDVTFDIISVFMKRHQKLEAFAIADWLQHQSLPGKLRAMSKAKALTKAHAENTVVRKVAGLSFAAENAADLLTNTTGGVALIDPKQT